MECHDARGAHCGLCNWVGGVKVLVGFLGNSESFSNIFGIGRKLE